MSGIDLFNGISPEEWDKKHKPIDLFNGISPEAWGKTPKLVQGEEKGFFSRMMDRLTRDPDAERARAANVMAIAKAQGVTPVEAERRYEDVKDTVRDQPGLVRTAQKIGGSGPVKGAAKFLPRAVTSAALATNDALALGAGVLDNASRSVSRLTGLSTGGGFGKARDWLHEQSSALESSLSEGSLIGPSDHLKGKKLLENPGLLLDPEWVMNNVADTAGSMIPALAAAYASGGGSTAAGLAGGGMEGGSMYRDMSAKKTVDNDKALAASMAYGTVSAFLNKIGFDGILDKTAAKNVKDRIMRSILKGGTEAATEWAEQPAQALIQTLAEGGTKDEVIGKVLESMKDVDVLPGSFLLGGGVAYRQSSPGAHGKATINQTDPAEIHFDGLNSFPKNLHGTKTVPSSSPVMESMAGNAVGPEPHGTSAALQESNNTPDASDSSAPMGVTPAQGPRYDIGYNLPKNTVAGGVDEISALFDETGKVASSGEKRAVRFDVVTPDRAARLKEATGLNLDGFRHSVDSYGIGHILKSHGDPVAEARRGQVPVTQDDILRIPEIVRDYDAVIHAGKADKTGQDLVRYEKVFGDTVYYVEEVRRGRNELAAKTMWKVRVPRDVSDVSAGGGGPRPLRPERDALEPPRSVDNVTPDGMDVKGVKTPSGYASAGEYADISPVKAGPLSGYQGFPIEMPEAVELYNEVTGGKHPHVRRRLRGHVQGRFIPDTGDVEVAADIFGNPSQALRVMLHEIGHVVDWVPEKTLARGNILGHLASLKRYMKHQIEEAPGVGGPHITWKDKQRLKDEARRMVQADADAAVDADITAELPVTPADILSVFNAMEPSKAVTPDLMNYIKGMSTAEKKSLVKAAMKGLVPEEIQRLVAGSKKAPDAREVSEAESMAKFEELFKAELKRRRLVHRSVVMDELKAFTRKWRPFDESADKDYTAYRNKPAELYADAFSAFASNPGFLEQEAPVYFNSFVAYMQAKPEVKQVWDKIQARYGEGEDAVVQNRLDREWAGYAEGREKRKAMANEKPEKEGMLASLARGLMDKNQPMLDLIASVGKVSPEAAAKGKNLVYELEETRHIENDVNVYTKRFMDEVQIPLSDAGISFDAFDSYLMAHRVLGDRASLANPGGAGPVSARATIEKLRKDWGWSKTKVADEAKEAFRGIRERFVFPLMKESAMYSQDLLDMIESNSDYVRVSVNSKIEKKYGASVSATIFKQYGTFGPNESPSTATALQDFSVMRAARLNMAKRNVVTFLESFGSGEIQPAVLRFSKTAEHQVPAPPPDPRKQSILTVLHHGQPKHYYVHPSITEMFERDPVDGNAVTEFLRRAMVVPRQLMVSKNPKWMIKNALFVDPKNTFKNLKEIRHRDLLKFGSMYREAVREVMNEVFRGVRSHDIEQGLMAKAIPTHRAYKAWDESIEGALDHVINNFSFEPLQARQNYYAKQGLAQYFEMAMAGGKLTAEGAERLGQASELIGKVAAYKYLKKYTNLSDREIAHKVRNLAATPDFKRRGAWHALTNNLFLFSTVNMGGLRGTYEAIKDAPGAYIFKTFTFDLMPRLALWGIRSGVLYSFLRQLTDDDDDWLLAQVKRLQRIIAGIPAHDLATRNVIPLWLNEDGQSVYLAIPQDYMGQFFGALFYKSVIEPTVTGPDGVLSLVYDQLPWSSTNPVVEIIGNYVGYYAMGHIPVDSYRGRQIMTPQQAASGGLDAFVPLLKQNWRDLGLGTIYTMPYDDLETEGSWYREAGKLYGINALTQFLRVSDRGVKDRLDKAVGEVRKQKARESVIRKDVYIRMMNADGQPVQISMEEAAAFNGQSPSSVEKAFMKLIARKFGNVYYDAFVNANSVDERRAVLAVMYHDGGNIAYESPNTGSPFPAMDVEDAGLGIDDSYGYGEGMEEDNQNETQGD